LSVATALDGVALVLCGPVALWLYAWTVYVVLFGSWSMNRLTSPPWLVTPVVSLPAFLVAFPFVCLVRRPAGDQAPKRARTHSRLRRRFSATGRVQVMPSS